MFFFGCALYFGQYRYVGLLSDIIRLFVFYTYQIVAPVLSVFFNFAAFYFYEGWIECEAVNQRNIDSGAGVLRCWPK